MACNITRLEPGSVVFEDVCTEIVKGQVLKPLERGHSRQQNDALPGRIRYRAADHSEVEIPFGEKDQCGDFTLRYIYIYIFFFFSQHLNKPKVLFSYSNNDLLIKKKKNSLQYIGHD